MPATQKMGSLQELVEELATILEVKLLPPGSTTYVDTGQARLPVDRMFLESFTFSRDIRTDHMPCDINVPISFQTPGIADWFVYRLSKYSGNLPNTPWDHHEGTGIDLPQMLMGGSPNSGGEIKYVSSEHNGVQSEALYVWNNQSKRSVVVTHNLWNTGIDYLIFDKHNVCSRIAYHPLRLPELLDHEHIAKITNPDYNSMHANGYTQNGGGTAAQKIGKIREHLGIPSTK